MTYTRPVNPDWTASWESHKHRTPPSSEPGTDYGCHIGTAVHAAADGTVADVGGSIDWATGLYLTIDLDDGRRVRYLHLSVRFARVGDRVARGAVVAASGATGYGSDYFGVDPNDADAVARVNAETGGPHVHTTLFPRHAYQFGDNTLDFDAYVNASPDLTGSGSTTSPEEDDMTKPYVQVKDERGNFAIVGPDGVGRILSGAQLRGAQKIAGAANGGELPEVQLSNEEWDAGTLERFGSQVG